MKYTVKEFVFGLEQPQTDQVYCKYKWVKNDPIILVVLPAIQTTYIYLLGRNNH